MQKADPEEQSDPSGKLYDESLQLCLFVVFLLFAIQSLRPLLIFWFAAIVFLQACVLVNHATHLVTNGALDRFVKVGQGVLLVVGGGVHLFHWADMFWRDGIAGLDDALAPVMIAGMMLIVGVVLIARTLGRARA